MTDLDLSNPGFYQNPYPAYAKLHERARLFRSTHGPWVAAGFDEVTALVKDPRVSVGFPGEPGWRDRRGPAALADGGRWMLLTDGAAHLRLRRPASRFLTPRALAPQHQRLGRLVGSVLDTLPSSGRLDFAAQVAEPVVATLVADILGLPGGHQHDLNRWSSAIIRMADPLTPARVRTATDTAMGECRAFIEHSHQSQTLRPDGLAAQLLADDSALTPPEAVANIVLLAVAGIDTTVGQLCSAMLGLLHHPQELVLLRQDPQAAGAATLEFIRHQSPVQIITRRITQDIATPAGIMRTGEKLMLLLGAANRDPRRYVHPERLCLDRPEVEPLGFGGGPHYCVGAHLAQLILGTVLGEFVRRHPHPQLTGPDPSWRHSVVARRLQHLWMDLAPR